MTFTRRATLALLAAAAFAATPLAAQTPDEIKAKGSITVGMLVDFPPFGIMNTDNQPDGYDADVAKLLAEDLGVKLTILPVTGPNRIPYLLSGQVDVLVASLGITAGARRAGRLLRPLCRHRHRRLRRHRASTSPRRRSCPAIRSA